MPMTTTEQSSDRAPAPPAAWRGALSTYLPIVARLVLGGVWIAAGAAKAFDLAESVRAVRAYRLLPEAVATVVGAGLPWLEIGLGVLLIVGLGVRAGAVVSVLLQAVFLTGIISAAARGLRIDCGCFGNGGDLAAGAPTAYTAEIVRDTGLLLLACLLAYLPGRKWSVDSWIAGPSEHPGHGKKRSR
jgi:uncharacterized membrane protein YphA (DoxX/SURF4 family)